MTDVETDAQERHLSIDDDASSPLDGDDGARGEAAAVAEPDENDTWVDPRTGEVFHRLSPFERKVVSLVIGQGVERLKLLQELKVDPEEQAEELSKAQGETISAIMNRQAELEERFQALLLEREEINRADLPMAHALARNKEESLKVAEQMRATTEELCAKLQGTPDIDAINLRTQEAIARGMTVMSSIIEDVERDGTWPSLNAFNAEMDAAKAAEDAAVAEAREDEGESEGQEKSLEEKKAEMEAAEKENAATIEALKRDIQAKLRSNAIELRFLEADLKGKGDEESQLARQRISELERQVAEAEALIEEEQSVHKATCEFLQNRIDALNKQNEETQERHKRMKDEMERKISAATQDREAAERELEEEKELYEKAKAAYDEWLLKKETEPVARPEGEEGGGGEGGEEREGGEEGGEGGEGGGEGGEEKA